MISYQNPEFYNSQEFIKNEEIVLMVMILTQYYSDRDTHPTEIQRYITQHMMLLGVMK